jgi:hypothetical protein
MKLTPRLLLAAAVVLTLAGNLRAQVFITPNTPVVGDSSVFTQGTEIFGGTVSGSFTLANGVQFNHQLINSQWSPAGTPVSYPSVPAGPGIEVVQDGAAFGDQTGNLGFSDNALNQTLQFNAATGGQLFLYIGNLTPNHVYAIQTFDAMTTPATGGFDNGVGSYNATETVGFSNTLFGPLLATSTLNYGQAGGGSGAFSNITTFAAASGGTAFLEFYNSNNGIDLLSAVQIRDISAVPEPSTYAMMLAGLAILGFCIRRKSVSVK